VECGIRKAAPPTPHEAPDPLRLRLQLLLIDVIPLPRPLLLNTLLWIAKPSRRNSAGGFSQ
jgi:hypothetical protein